MDVKRNIPWDLIIAHLKNKTAPHDEAALSKWLGIEENKDLYLELSSLWDEIQRESGGYSPDEEYYWRKIEERIDLAEKKNRKPAVYLKRIRTIAVAASVLLAVAASFFIGKNASAPLVREQAYTALSGKSQMTLPDGTSVWLNLGSTLTYTTSFLNKRIVRLEGEALFDVENNPESPFMVEMNNVSVKVLGTRFNIQAYKEQPDIKIALLEGKVSVLANDEELFMNTGEIARYNKESRNLQIGKDDVLFESSWANKSYTFTARSLEYICKYLEKWYNVSITVDPVLSGSQVYTFTITDEPLETILQIMSRINPIAYAFEDDRKVTIKHVKPAR